MSNLSVSPTFSEVGYPPAISFRELWPWTLFAASILLFAIYMTGSYQGSATLHEFFHDGRHLLGFPCH